MSKRYARVDKHNPFIAMSEESREEKYLQFPNHLGSDGNHHFMQFTVFKRSATIYKKVEKWAARSNPLYDREEREEALKDIENKYPQREKGDIVGNISLYIPGQLQTQYSMNYEDTDTNLVGALTTNEIVDISGTTFNFLKMYGLELGERILGGKGIIQKQANAARNPYMEVIFRSPNFREHSFEFKFYPMNEQESENVKKIIHKFKYHMHPDFHNRTIRSIYTYPDEFEIEFGNDQSRPYLFRIGRSYLTSINVDYHAQQIPSYFQKTGAPTMISLQLTFKETQMLSKAEIEEGY